eukprot:3375539-Prymnesium_polylepis.1
MSTWGRAEDTCSGGAPCCGRVSCVGADPCGAARQRGRVVAASVAWRVWRGRCGVAGVAWQATRYGCAEHTRGRGAGT